MKHLAMAYMASVTTYDTACFKICEDEKNVGMYVITHMYETFFSAPKRENYMKNKATEQLSNLQSDSFNV